MPPNDWALTPKAAIARQRELATQVDLKEQPLNPRYIAGTDVGFEANGTITRGVVALLSYPELQPVEIQIVRCTTTLPYIPGLLSFREAPALLQALEQLSIKPDLLLCDGQGIAHPRRFGIACHLGVLTGIPAIGVAKSRLIGDYQEPQNEKGSRTPLTDQGEPIGEVLRTRKGVKPLLISPGHRLSIESATEWVLRCVDCYRLPEPIRWADGIASRRPVFLKRAAELGLPVD